MAGAPAPVVTRNSLVERLVIAYHERKEAVRKGEASLVPWASGIAMELADKIRPVSHTASLALTAAGAGVMGVGAVVDAFAIKQGMKARRQREAVARDAGRTGEYYPDLVHDAREQFTLDVKRERRVANPITSPSDEHYLWNLRTAKTSEKEAHELKELFGYLAGVALTAEIAIGTLAYFFQSARSTLATEFLIVDGALSAVFIAGAVWAHRRENAHAETTVRIHAGETQSGYSIDRIRALDQTANEQVAADTLPSARRPFGMNNLQLSVVVSWAMTAVDAVALGVAYAINNYDMERFLTTFGGVSIGFAVLLTVINGLMNLEGRDREEASSGGTPTGPTPPPQPGVIFNPPPATPSGNGAAFNPPAVP